MSASVNGNGSFLRMREVIALVGVSSQTIRNEVKRGNLDCRVLPSGHRVFSLAQVKAYCGYEESENEGRNPVGYIRISTKDANQLTSGKNQEQTLRQHIAKQYGIDPASVRIYSDIGKSSFGSRPSLNQLVEDVISGNVSEILVTNRSRFSRVPALTRLLESVCEKRNVGITVLEQEENQDSLAEGMLELVEFCHCLSARQTGARAKLVNEMHLTAEAGEKITELYGEGLPIRAITEKLRELGYRQRNGKGEHPISKHVVRKFVLGSETAQLTEPNKDGSFQKFIKKHVRHIKKGCGLVSTFATQRKAPTLSIFRDFARKPVKTAAKQRGV